ncbi:MAG: YqcI/YcgG family protein [Chitinophagaceae bacterium]|nr:YqcI/YcgG family protein [Oligoflexus sp.]
MQIAIKTQTLSKKPYEFKSAADLVHNPLESCYEKLVRDYVSNMGFPCVGAKTALAKDQINICVAQSILSNESDEKILTGLYDFISHYKKDKVIFRSFIVVFDDKKPMSEEDFEMALWTRLQSLHDKDIFPWDTAVSAHPSDKTFSLSAGNKAFYIIGMHPGSSRDARRFPLPALVFNLHEQFEQLRATGQYQQMRQLIRRRDKAFSGSTNPMLEDFGNSSEAVQYSGRQVAAEEWKCPFHHKGLH